MIPVRTMQQTWGTGATTIFTFILFWNMLRRCCPSELRRYLEKWTIRLSGFLNPYIQIYIHDYLGNHLRTHEAYAIVEAYLSVYVSKDAKRFKAEMTSRNKNKLMLSMAEYEKTTDEFNGVRVKWISGKLLPPQRAFSYSPDPERWYYKLEFHKRHKEMITETYLEHVIKTGREIRARNRQRKLYSNGHSGPNKSYWSHMVFEHPARFETLAMEPEKKQEIIDDLLTFRNSKDYYARIGKAWKRGYLLYGPPGTGKSTMIAAMANLLDYSVYDLELTSVKDNAELRKLLTETTAKSIIVIEDIDCSLDLTGQRQKREEKSSKQNTERGERETTPKEKEERESQVERESKVTLSGLLNFIDGLWSACAAERLIVFTTNHADKLDPALTRRGRMDKHIELSYCKYEGFKVLAKNYLELAGHALFRSVEELIEEVEITPADVAEHLMPKSAKESPEQCLLNLIRSLEEAKNRKIMKCTEVIERETENDAAAPQGKHEN